MFATVGKALGQAALWELREIGSLTRDLWRSRHWPGWFKIAGILTFGAQSAAVCIVVFTAVVGGLILCLAYIAGGWFALSAWSVAAYAAIAGVTGVPRARHRIRRDVRFALVSVTHGLIDQLPPGNRRHYWQPRPRLKFRRFHRELLRGSLPLAQAWRQGTDEARVKLIDEVRSRLRPHGAEYDVHYTLEWFKDAPVPVLRQVAKLPEQLDAKLWTPPRGLMLLGATDGAHPKAVEINGLAFAAWNRRTNPHILFAGETGNGKTAALRWLTRSAYDAARAVTWTDATTGQTRHRELLIAGIDGKRGGNLAYLEGRKGVLGVGDEPHEWVETARIVAEIMRHRYTELRKWRKGEAKKPWWGADVFLIVDEFIDIRESEQGDEVLGYLSEIARMGREAGCTLVLSVLRPDTSAAVPGLIRQQLGGRLYLGAIRGHTDGQMMFEGQWRDAYALSDPDDDEIPGRGLARLGGRVYPIQIPWIPDPAEDREAAELWLPPRRSAPDEPEVEAPAELPSVDAMRWTPADDAAVHDLGAARPKRERRRTRAGVPVDRTSGDPIDLTDDEEGDD